MNQAEDGFGVEFKGKANAPKTGEVWRYWYIHCEDADALVIGDKSYLPNGQLFDDDLNKTFERKLRNEFGQGMKKIANSLEEYYRKKFNGQLND